MLARLRLLRTPATSRLGLLQPRRLVASSVSNRPASQTPGHATQNIKEEVGHSVSDLAKAIAGGATNVQLGSTTKSGDAPDSFVGITSAVASSVPAPVMAFGLAGAIPYVGTTLSTLYFARQASMAITGSVAHVDPVVALTALSECLHIQMTYGAVLLSFLGALHWGMEFAAPKAQQLGWRRLALGAAPVLVAWPTLMLEPTLALTSQWVAFTGLWFADMRATSAGWTPSWYSQYRFYLTLIVGMSIVATLAGTNYLGPLPGASHGAPYAELVSLRNARRRREVEALKEIRGGIDEGHKITAKAGDFEEGKGEDLLVKDGVTEGADAFVVIGHPKHDEEEKKKN